MKIVLAGLQREKMEEIIKKSGKTVEIIERLKFIVPVH